MVLGAYIHSEGGCMATKPKTAVHSTEAPEPVGPYSQAVLSGSLIFVSGQLGMKPGCSLPDTVEEQASQALQNLESILRAAGASLDDVLKTTVLLSDMGDFSKVNKIYSGFFREPFPSRAAFQVVALPLNAMVEIEAVARLKER